MPNVYGKTSLKNRAELHPDMVKVLDKSLERRDHSIIDAARSEEEQRRNVMRGVSKTMESRHLVGPLGWAEAADVVPYPLPPDFWRLVERGLAAVRAVDPTMQVLRLYNFSGFVNGVGHGMGIPIRSGLDWDSDGDVHDQSFIDGPHHELVRPSLTARPVPELKP